MGTSEKITRLLGPDGLKRIESAVAQAESGTCGQIATYIAWQSDSYPEAVWQGAALGAALLPVALLTGPYNVLGARVHWSQCKELRLPDGRTYHLVHASKVCIDTDVLLEQTDRTPLWIEGDSFHRYERAEMQARIAKAEEERSTFSHFSIDANLLEVLEETFRQYGETGATRRENSPPPGART